MLNAQPINVIRTQLYAGVWPRDIVGAEWLESGSDRTVWRIGAFVVKAAPSWMNRMVPGFPIRRAPIVKVRTRNGVFEIQRYYPGARTDALAKSPGYSEAKRNTNFDLHWGNMGVDRHGRLVAFDW